MSTQISPGPSGIVLLLIALVGLIACAKSEPLPRDASVQAEADAGARPRIAWTVKAHLEDGATEVLEFESAERLDGGRAERSDRPRIAPSNDLEVAANHPLRNFRIRLFDETDRALSSDDVFDDRDQGLNYRILLREPLKPGHRYTLVLDAQSGTEITDLHGNPQPDQRLEFQVAGQREKPARQKPVGKNRKRR
jgi:hypothetical protein